MKRICALILCLLCVSVFLPACSGDTIELTEEQRARIDVIVENREKWAETVEYIATYPVNAAHIAELDSGYTILTVAHISGKEKNWTYYVGVCGYGVVDGKLLSIGQNYHEDWLANYVTVDLETMSDQELREALEQSYRASLSRK